MRRIALAACAALLLGLAGAGAARAGDTVLLRGGGNDAPTMTLGGADVGADTIDVRGYRGGYGGYYGGYRGYYGGGYRGYYGGYGGYRSYAYSRPWGYSYYSYRPYYYSSYYYPRVYSYSYGPSYCYGISETQLTPSYYLNVQPQRMDPVPEPQPRPTMPPASSGPYRYDGGPSNPVPMPQGTRPGTQPTPSVPLDGRPISLPSKSTTEPAQKYAYPAYGQPSGGSQAAPDRTLVIKK